MKLISKLKARGARHILVAGSAWGSRLITAGTQFLLVRILLTSIGVDQYAAFAVIVGLAAWFNLADFGVGTAVQNAMAEAKVRGTDPESIAYLGRIICVALITLCIPILYLLSPFFSTFLLKPFGFMNESESAFVFFYSGCFLAIAGISGIIYKIWYAEHRGYWSNVVPGLAAIAGFFGVVAATHFPENLRFQVSLAAYAIPMGLLPLLILISQLLREKRPLKFQMSFLVLLSKRSLGFWIFAVSSAATLQVDYIIISRFLNAEEISTYSVVSKVFGLIFFVYNAMLMAIWPLLAELQLRREWENAHRLAKKYIFLGIAGVGLGTVCVAAFVDLIMDVLAPGKNLHASLALIFGFGCYQAIRVWTDTYAVVLQSTSTMKPFWILVPLQATISVILQWTFVPILGALGVLIGLILSFLLTVSWALPVYFHIQQKSKK